MRPRLSWPKSLRGQFNLALAVLTFLIFSGGVIGIQTLQETVVSATQLGEERLARMEEAQELVHIALLIEHEAQLMLLANSFQDMRESYGKILVYLKTLDFLVSNLGQSVSSVSILSFQHSAQLFRGTVHVLAALHEKAIAKGKDVNQDAVLSSNLNQFNRNLVQQGTDLLTASKALSANFTAAYRESVRQLTKQSEHRRLEILGMLTVSLLLAWLVSSRFLGRFVILRLQKVSHYLRHGNEDAVVDPCVPVSGNDEIAEMARAVEQYISQRQQLVKVQQDAMQTARFVAVGQLAAGIAHEINTPAQYIGDNLMYIQSVVERVANDPACAAWTDETREVLSAIDDSQEGVQRISEIVSSMKEFSHPGVSGLAEADINRALETSLTVTRNQWKNVAKIERHLAPDLPRPRCDTGKINQVFLNLIVNAAQAIEESGKPYPGLITLSTSHVDGWVEIRIADTGTGIDAKTRERIFDPFFTTKPVGTGTGQGLAICHDVVVVKHGGTINISGAQGEGAEFIIRLPVSPAVDILGDDDSGIRQ